MKWKRVRRQAASLDQNTSNSTLTPPSFQILDSALQHLCNALNKNRKIQEAYLLVRKSKSSIKSKDIKQIYKDITQNRANSLLFIKSKEKLISYNLEKQEALFRAYRRAIQGCISKIACFYELQSTFSFCSNQINEIMRLVENCSNKAKKITNLDLFAKIIGVIFDQNQLLQGRIFEALLDRGYIISMEEFYKINGLGRQNPDMLQGNGIIIQEEQQNQNQQNNAPAYQYQKVQKLVHQPNLKNIKRKQKKDDDVSKRPRRIAKQLSISSLEAKQARKINNNSLKIKDFFAQLAKSEGLNKFYPQNQEKCDKNQNADKQRGFRKKATRLMSLISNLKSVQSVNQKVSAKLIDLIQSADNHFNRKYSYAPGMRYCPTSNIQRSLRRVMRKSYIGGLQRMQSSKQQQINLDQIQSEKKSSVKDKDIEGYSIINGIGPFLEIAQVSFSKRRNEKHQTTPTTPVTKRGKKLSSSQIFCLKNAFQAKQTETLKENISIQGVGNNSGTRKPDQSLFNNHIINLKLSRQKILKACGHQGHHQLSISQLDQQLKEIFRMNKLTQLLQEQQPIQNKGIKLDKALNEQKQNTNYVLHDLKKGEKRQSLLKKRSEQNSSIVNKLIRQLQYQQSNKAKLQQQKVYLNNFRSQITAVDLNCAFNQFQQMKNNKEILAFQNIKQPQFNFIKPKLPAQRQNVLRMTKSSRQLTQFQTQLPKYNTYDTRRKLIIR